MTKVFRLASLCAATLTLLSAARTSALAESACVAGKVRAQGRDAACKLLLEAARASSGTPIEAAATARCLVKLTKAFSKAESEGDCSTSGDLADVDLAASALVDEVAALLDVASGTNPNLCEGAKLRAAARKTRCKLDLIAKEQVTGRRPSERKFAKCHDAMEKTFAKLEAKGGCNTAEDADAVEARIDAFLESTYERLVPPVESTCAPVEVTAYHGTNGFFANTRLALVEDGRVPCVHIEKLTISKCMFRSDSGAWVEAGSDVYAVAGHAISKDGAPGGEWTIGIKLGPGRTVPCIDEPPSPPMLLPRDISGTPTASALATACTFETYLSARNASGGKLANFATRPVCTSSFDPHPDETASGPTQGDCFTSDGETPDYCCFTGLGAGLNDATGTERNDLNQYLEGSSRCHVAISSGIELYAAKRPATRLTRIGGVLTYEVVPDSALVWRPVASQVRIAN